MNVLYFIIPMALILGLFFLITFIFAIKKGQYDDLEGSANRILIDDSYLERKNDNAKNS
jgi:cbb3-type cytochrome oxidase maturation protein